MAATEAGVRSRVDQELQRRFSDEYMRTAPHWEGKGDDGRIQTVVNPTPLVDLTRDVVECARNLYGIELSGLREFRVLGKLESAMAGGSIKTRAALGIIKGAIDSGKLRRGQVIFEATSGNFGIALGLLSKLGFRVVALVSKELKQGVLEELKNTGVKIVDLEIEICPAPGMMQSSGDGAQQNAAGDGDDGDLVAGDSSSIMSVVLSVRQQLAMSGLDPTVFDRSRVGADKLLKNQDAIGLAKLLADAYGGFCPSQYDNELNVKVHATLTGPEIDQQLRDGYGSSLADFKVICAFGTGGTSGGLSAYVRQKYRKEAVHVVFPREGQDVAGIRTKSKAAGLKFYSPLEYAGQHEVDFRTAKESLGFFVRRGYDIGESSALALFSVMQMANTTGGGNYVVILADGFAKYARGSGGVNMEVKISEAVSSMKDYAGIVWAHPVFSLSTAGARLIASSLGVGRELVTVAETEEVERYYFGGPAIPSSIAKVVGGLDGGRRKLLLVCTNGSTSLRLAQLLSTDGIHAESLSGGIAELSKEVEGGERSIDDFLEPVTRN